MNCRKCNKDIPEGSVYCMYCGASQAEKQRKHRSANGTGIVGMNRDSWYAEYHECVKRIGVRDLPPYSCRHTTATALALGDQVAPLLITRIMRQTRPLTTERYKHADEQTILDALNSLNRM